jgi:hypothetical protein
MVPTSIHRAVPLVLLCAAAAAASDRSERNGYTLQIIAQTGSVIGGQTIQFVHPASINDQNEVSFSANCTPSLLGEFTQDGHLSLLGGVIGGLTLNRMGDTAINNRGTVAFLGGFGNNGSAIFSRSSVIVKSGDVIGGKTLTEVEVPASINNRGTIVFASQFSSGRGIFTPSALLFKTGDTIGGKVLTEVGGYPVINDVGMVVDSAFFSGGSGIVSTGEGIFGKNERFIVKTGDVVDGRTLNTVSFSSVNNVGVVAFAGSFSGSHGLGAGIFTPNRLLVQTGDVIDGKTVTSIDRISMNDLGTIAFTTADPGPDPRPVPPAQPGPGLFTTSSLFHQSKLVLYKGDTVAGKTVQSVLFPAINNLGRIVFLAVFTDQTSAIVVARPR